MTIHTINLQTTLEVEEQFLMDILVTAVEGGINYWCALMTVERNDDLDVLSFTGHDHEDIDEKFSCDIHAVLRALEVIVNSQGGEFVGIKQYIIEQDACMIDAEVADTIVQIAIFNEVTYG